MNTQASMTLVIGNRHRSQHATLHEAVETYSRLRDESGEGTSTWPDGKVGHLRISYNSRVWDGKQALS